ncbi:hypothetical protein T01_11790 [Trichinella spiralis]|uniref:Uncharacterized protein n=1 Tax=Trichinella spiralis TaxID=6334 RepID=A0A0V1BYX0_TRISP|nr:hypothetical protein T01_11790 [Trichinella spiralis]
MSFMHCIFVVLFFAVGEAQMQMLGETTHYGRNDPVMLPKAREALFSSDSKEQSGVLHKLVELEESSTMGILTTMKVVIQDTECRYVFLILNPLLPNEDSLAFMDLFNFSILHITMYYITVTVKAHGSTVHWNIDIALLQQQLSANVVSQRSQMLGGTTKYTDSNVHIKEEVKQAIFESDKKKSSGTYLLLDKIVEGFNMGISSRFQVLVKETECDIKEKAFNSYEDVYKNCSGSGDSKVCSVEYKYFDPTKSTVEC